MSGGWYGRDMPEMWSSAQAADTRMAWDQVLAWRRTHDLLDFHQGRLRRARDELVRAWPPERSPAAAAFAARIDTTIRTLDEAKISAARNQDALAAVLSSLRDTRNDMAGLVAEWEEHRKAPVVAGRAVVIPPAYTVTVKAQERMARNDQEVLAAYRTMVELPPIDDGIGGPPGGPTEPGSPGADDLSGAGGGPLVPPIVRSPVEVDAAAGLADAAGAGLAGVGGLPVQGGPAVPVGPDPSMSGGFVPGSGSVLPVPGSSRIPGSGAPFASGPAGRASGSSFGGATAGGRVGRAWINPVGGVIGAPPEVGSAGVSPHGTPTSAGGGHGASTGTGPGMPIGGAGGGRRTDERPTEPRRLLQWEVAEGVPPVIEAPEERPFELGPGVFGIDRA